MVLTSTFLSITRQVKTQATGTSIAPNCIVTHLITVASAVSALINIYTSMPIIC